MKRRNNSAADSKNDDVYVIEHWVYTQYDSLQ
jgi:hypothetical protein